MHGDGAALAVGAVLADGADAEVLVALGELTMTNVLAYNRGT